MGKVAITLIDEALLRSFPEIAQVPGYYLDVLTGDIFRNGGHFTEANQRITERHGDHAALQRKPFLLVSEDLEDSLEEVKEIVESCYGIPRQKLGKLVHSME